MRMMPSIAAAALMLASAPAEAAVLYDFTSGFGSFTLTTSDFISAQVNYTAAMLDSCTAVPSCDRVEFYPVTLGTLTTSGEYDGLLLFAPGFGVAYYFDDGAFGQVGTYSSVLINPGDATLRISGAPDPGIPEPATWAMLLAGFAVAGIGLRRNRAAHPQRA